MWLAIFMVFLGVVLLWGGAEAMVKGAVKLALDLGVPSLVVGLTVVAITTSLPEAFASITAQVVGHEGNVALGNVIGSNIANLGLVLGIALMICPLDIPVVIKRREMPIVVLASLLLFALMFFGAIGRWEGVLLLVGMVAYTLYQFKISEQEKSIAKQALQQEVVAKLTLWREILLVIVGVGLLIVGASFLIKGAIAIATHFGMSQRVIGLTIVAIGSSFPEIATVVVAAMKRRTDLILGNVFGSNIYNVTMVAGFAAVVAPIHFSPRMLAVDIPVMLAFTVAAWALVHFRKRLGRIVGIGFVLSYLFYLGYVI